jgi:spore maturation protein CgeB
MKGPAPTFDRSILAVLPLHDHGDPTRGQSCETHFFLPAFESLVRDVHLLAADAVFARSGAIDREILRVVDRFRPDLVFFVPYRDDVGHATLAELRRHTTTVAFFGDDQWRFDDYSSGYATAFTHVITTDPRAVGRYRDLGGSPILSEWAGRLVGPPLPPLNSDAAFSRDVAFVGGCTPYRAWLCSFLADRGIDVECFGAGWPNGRIDFAGAEEVFRTSRINLNLPNSRQHDTRFLLADPRHYLANRQTSTIAEQVKARHFEIALAGGFQLSNYAIGLEEHLAIGPEIAIFGSPDDCVAQVARYLRDPARRIEMARRAQARSLAEHTYEHRMADVLGHVWPAATAVAAA